MPHSTSTTPSLSPARAGTPRHIAIVGAGMAGLSCARALVQAGHRVTLLEKSRGYGGRMSTKSTEFGTFDHGAQYFTVRDPRFATALQATPDLVRPWSVTTVRVLDETGQAVATNPPPLEPHWVPAPGMNSLTRQWGEQLATHTGQVQVHRQTKVERIERDALHPEQWQLRTTGPENTQHVYGGFDQVVLAAPHPQALALLQASELAPALQQALAPVTVAPCWTLMVAYPQAMQPNLPHIGPQWNAARSTHHRISWMVREASKPGRGGIERWTIQANPAWTAEHVNDSAERVTAKLLKAFAEVSGIHAEPSFSAAHRWLYAQTQQPLGQPYLWDASLGLGLCGDWCLGHRVENAFVSGLELGLKLA